ncbi:MAG: hypothetical protein ACJAQ0_001160 [Dasania sp.]|jgi:hypothetical protein
MRFLIKFIYARLFLLSVCILIFCLTYGVWYGFDLYRINLLGHYFDHFLSLEHGVIILAIPFFLRNYLVAFSEKQSIFLYKSYLRQLIFLKYFMLKFIIWISISLLITVLSWCAFDIYHVNIAGIYFDRLLSPEHIMLAFIVILFPSFLWGHKTRQKSNKVFFKYYETKGRYISNTTKAFVLKRDKNKCRQCGSKRQLEYDHIKPYSRGGSNRPHNIQLLCFKCNRKKGNTG